MLLILKKSTKFQIIKKTYYSLIDGVVINKHTTIYTNDNTNVTKLNKLVNFNDNSFHKENRAYK